MLLPGDVVRVRSAPAIAATLDAEGALERLPFTPEMATRCGRTFRVLMRAERACVRGLPPGERPIRELDGTVVLEGERCDGAAHGGCELGCMLLWKEAWLERTGARAEPDAGPGAAGAATAFASPGGEGRVFRCQATELARATRPAPPLWSPWQYARFVRVGTLSATQLAAMYARIAAEKLVRVVRAPGRSAPERDAAAESLGLRPGEWVEVRSRREIDRTLDARGALRGLGFSNYMYRLCGKRLKVARRVDRIIAEESGRLRVVRDTVLLEGSFCERHHGCARGMPTMWREAWLKRVEDGAAP